MNSFLFSFCVHKVFKELQQLSTAITRECQNVLRQIIQNAFDGMIERCPNVKMQVDGHSFPDE